MQKNHIVYNISLYSVKIDNPSSILGRHKYNKRAGNHIIDKDIYIFVLPYIHVDINTF